MLDDHLSCDREEKNFDDRVDIMAAEHLQKLDTDDEIKTLREVYFDGTLEAHTSNGSIKASLYGEDSDYYYELKTSNGSIKLGSEVHGKKYTGGNGQSKLKLNTSNADITVKFDSSK